MNESSTRSLVDATRDVLLCADPSAKARAARAFAAVWRGGTVPLLPADGARVSMPDRPARPPRPLLLHPHDMPKRSFKGMRGRFALLHALAHIELNAIDLAFDMAGRFAGEDMPAEFHSEWIQVGDDEARHYLMLGARLEELGGQYGDLPAHDSLWQAAEESRHDLMIRLAIVPLVLEARGLDVTPGMIARLEAVEDMASASLLRTILKDEEEHVRIGMKWFTYVCQLRAADPEESFHRLVRKHFRGALKPPFNERARNAAGMQAGFYHPLMKA
jgi:uncharacterized ferritin-like protein (DUF455 family)